MSVDDKNQAPNVPERNELRKPTSQKIKAPAKEVSVKWLVTALLLLSAPPLAAGVFRLSVLASESEITLTNERFFAVTLPVVLHILCSIVYAILGAFQFATGFRRHRLGWHRAAGLLLVLCGLMVGISGLWMTLFYPRVDGTGEQLLEHFPAHVWFGHGRVYPSRHCRNPAREGGSTRRMDDTWLCDWAWCGYTDVDTIAIGWENNRWPAK